MWRLTGAQLQHLTEHRTFQVKQIKFTKNNLVKLVSTDHHHEYCHCGFQMTRTLFCLHDGCILNIQKTFSRKPVSRISIRPWKTPVGVWYSWFNYQKKRLRWESTQEHKSPGLQDQNTQAFASPFCLGEHMDLPGKGI